MDGAGTNAETQSPCTHGISILLMPSRGTALPPPPSQNRAYKFPRTRLKLLKNACSRARCSLDFSSGFAVAAIDCCVVVSPCVRRGFGSWTAMPFFQILSAVGIIGIELRSNLGVSSDANGEGSAKKHAAKFAFSSSHTLIA